MTAIEKYYNRIMETKIDLYDLVGDEKNSLEGGLVFLSDFVKDKHARKKAKKHSKERLNRRRNILDSLINRTGGVTNLKNINLRSLANPNDDKTTGVLTSSQEPQVKDLGHGRHAGTSVIKRTQTNFFVL